MLGVLAAVCSALGAVVAIRVAVWQARLTANHAQRQNALPVVSEIFREWRSEEFRAHRSAVLSGCPVPPPPDGLAGLPPDWRESAHTVCHFFDYLGALVAFDLAEEDLIIGVMGTQIMQVWRIMEPIVAEERRFRERTFPPDTPTGFLSYYEDLVCRALDRGGRDSTANIQRSLKIRRLPRPLCDGPFTTPPAAPPAPR